MTRRTLGFIFGALFLLLALVAVLRFATGRRPAADAGPDFAAAVDSSTSLVRVASPEGSDSLRLERRAGQWVVNGNPADTAKVRGLLAGLDTLAPGRLVARSAANHARMGVAADSARHVRIGPASDPALQVLLGDAGPGNVRYVRRPEEDAVYAVDGRPLDLLTEDPMEWRDRLIVAVDTAAVRELRVRRGGGGELVVRRTEAGWTVDGAPADSARVRRMLQALATLRATGFPPDSVVFELDFESPDVVVEAFAEAAAEPGATVAPLASLWFVALEDGPDWFVRRADGAVVYGLASWAAERLLPAPEELRAGE